MSVLTWRTLDRHVVSSLDDYLAAGGGAALTAARSIEPAAVIEELEASGLRGRGGAGFPTGTKWRTVVEETADGPRPSVAINAGEGEIGTFKDRALIRRNPYKILEGALIAAQVVGASEIVVGLTDTFDREFARLTRATAELEAAGWTDGVAITVVGGPPAYLLGEETGLLETLEGRQPFPRVAPPFRRGFEDADDDVEAPNHLETPTLVNNAETFANIAAIVEDGADWFRSVGTDPSPGTVIVTVSGDVRHHGVAEVPLGTTLGEAIEAIGWGLGDSRTLLGVVNGASNPLLPPRFMDVPLTYEAMAAEGVSLGSCSFIVFDDRRDPVAIAAGLSRFLAVESCGQCEPCKADGLELSGLLARLTRHDFGPTDRTELLRRVDTVARGARCNLGRQQEAVVSGLLRFYPDAVEEHEHGRRDASEPVDFAPIRDVAGGRAQLEDEQFTKQPDWTHDPIDSGSWPAARLEDTPVSLRVGDESTSTSLDLEAAAEPSDPDPVELLRCDHEHIDDLLVRLQDGDEDVDVADLSESLRVHCEMARRVLVPMVERYGGAEGDDVVWNVDDRDLALEAEAEGLTDGDDVAEVAERFHRHVAEEEAMVPIIRDRMNRQVRATLAEAIIESRLTAPDPGA
jgi:NADH:ubiquinone oxidoreductase subunit F (NADH-binding)